MKKIVMFAAALLATTTLWAGHDHAAKAAKPEKATKGTPEFEKIKSLEGIWTGRMMDAGKDAGEMSAVYKVTGGGSTVQETLFPGTPHEMVTMYHMDGDAVVLTHYCAEGNQPHMKLKSSEGGAMSFECIPGGTNMKESDAHMHSAKLTVTDADHMSALWTMSKEGKKGHEAAFTLTRKK